MTEEERQKAEEEKQRAEEERKRAAEARLKAAEEDEARRKDPLHHYTEDEINAHHERDLVYVSPQSCFVLLAPVLFAFRTVFQLHFFWGEGQIFLLAHGRGLSLCCACCCSCCRACCPDVSKKLFIGKSSSTSYTNQRSSMFEEPQASTCDVWRTPRCKNTRHAMLRKLIKDVVERLMLQHPRWIKRYNKYRCDGAPIPRHRAERLAPSAPSFNGKSPRQQALSRPCSGTSPPRFLRFASPHIREVA